MKEKIFNVKGLEIAGQKLIMKGVNTVDANTLESYKMKDGDFMVVMCVKVDYFK